MGNGWGMKANGDSRREFLGRAIAVGGGVIWASSGVLGDQAKREMKLMERPLFVSTWPFGKPANEAALAAVSAGGSLLDGIEQGIRLTEADVSNSSVGIGGIPNAAGVVQLDACVMLGLGHKAGSVSSLEDIAHPISVARRVMEKTPHVMLAGAGAREFALAEGFEKVNLLTPGQKAAWERWSAARQKPKQKVDEKHHDTIALVGLDKDGNLAGGCSTSGWGYKLPGRVGDSPIIGGGLYVDNDIGAAGATGLGENVLRYCGSFMVVDFMERGLSPVEACLATIRKIAKKDPKGFDLSINFIAINKSGEYGAAGTGQGFQYAVTAPGFSQVLQSPGVTSQDVGPVGGNIK